MLGVAPNKLKKNMLRLKKRGPSLHWVFLAVLRRLKDIKCTTECSLLQERLQLLTAHRASVTIETNDEKRLVEIEYTGRIVILINEYFRAMKLGDIFQACHQMRLGRGVADIVILWKDKPIIVIEFKKAANQDVREDQEAQLAGYMSAIAQDDAQGDATEGIEGDFSTIPRFGMTANRSRTRLFGYTCACLPLKYEGEGSHEWTVMTSNLTDSEPLEMLPVLLEAIVEELMELKDQNAIRYDVRHVDGPLPCAEDPNTVTWINDNVLLVSDPSTEPPKEATIVKVYDYHCRDRPIEASERRAANREHMITAWGVEYESQVTVARVAEGETVQLLRYPYWPECQLKCDVTPQHVATVCRQLARLHATGVAHGDVRSLNIVWGTEGDRSFLIDFDFAGRVGDKRYPSGYTPYTRIVERHRGAVGGALLSFQHDRTALVNVIRQVFTSKTRNSAAFRTITNELLREETDESGEASAGLLNAAAESFANMEFVVDNANREILSYRRIETGSPNGVDRE